MQFSFPVLGGGEAGVIPLHTKGTARFPLAPTAELQVPKRGPPHGRAPFPLKSAAAQVALRGSGSRSNAEVEWFHCCLLPFTRPPFSTSA